MRLTNKKLLLSILGLLLAVLIVKIALFVTAKPKITVNYVAEYNRMSRPQDYDPNDNAAPYYQKAFDTFVETPDKFEYPHIDWPEDFNSADQALLQEWLTSNTQAFEYFREAVDKPYYWLEREAQEDNFMGSMMLPELAVYRELTNALIWEAKLTALEGRFHAAFENILDCYRAGKHKCRPNVLPSEQHVGLRIKQTAVSAALVILDRVQVDNRASKFFQDDLQQELDTDTYVPGSQAERLLDYDMLQRTFVDNGRGAGRLWWRMGFDIVIPLVGEGKIYERKIKLSCFTGPTKKQAAKQIEQTFSLFNQVITKTPWQIKDEGRDYFREIENINKRYISLEIFDIGIDANSIFHNYHKTRAQTEALITILAILRYKIDTGQFPETLNGLVSSGYLQAVPNDPYSSGPLVYKRTADGFTLYSIGADFSDNGGTTTIEQPTRFLGPRMPLPATRCADIVYWPVQQRSEAGTQPPGIKLDY